MYLFLDCETGGLDEDTSLLTLGMIVTDASFDIKDVKHWKLKPNDGVYKVTGQGLSVNKIQLPSHDKEAITYKEAKTELYDFLKYHYDGLSINGKKKLIPVGKNVYFDCLRIWGNLISRETWEDFVSYQPLEINGAWRLLEAQGKVPVLPKTSLTDLLNHFNIFIPCTWLHDALGDCRLYIELMKRMVQL